MQRTRTSLYVANCQLRFEHTQAITRTRTQTRRSPSRTRWTVSIPTRPIRCFSHRLLPMHRIPIVILHFEVCVSRSAICLMLVRMVTLCCSQATHTDTTHTRIVLVVLTNITSDLERLGNQDQSDQRSGRRCVSALSMHRARSDCITDSSSTTTLRDLRSNADLCRARQCSR
jgi:hypothetical protein